MGGNIVLGCPNTIPGRGAWMCRVKELTVSSMVEQWSDGRKADCRRGSGGEVNGKAGTRLQRLSGAKRRGLNSSGSHADIEQ